MRCRSNFYVVSSQILNLVNAIRPDADPTPDSKDDALPPLLACIEAPGLEHIDALWQQLSHTLTLLEESADPRAVLLLQPCVEAFFLAHAKPKAPQASSGKQTRSTGAAGGGHAADGKGAELL